jgi:hypothetical protein
VRFVKVAIEPDSRHLVAPDDFNMQLDFTNLLASGKDHTILVCDATILASRLIVAGRLPGATFGATRAAVFPYQSASLLITYTNQGSLFRSRTLGGK